jgi:hypothetical protein
VHVQSACVYVVKSVGVYRARANACIERCVNRVRISVVCIEGE